MHRDPHLAAIPVITASTPSTASSVRAMYDRRAAPWR